MPADSRIGTDFAGFHIESLLGRGGMAVVYLAEDRKLQRKVALKLLAPELSDDVRFRDRFIRESRLAASLDHPNIIPVYDAGEFDGTLYIAMRCVVGVDLKALLAREGPLQPARALAIVRQVAGALDSAHARGLVHRDVKPANILISQRTASDAADYVYLSDFGLAKNSSSNTGLTQTGQFVGTLDYVAPEQIEGRPIDGRADTYSLAALMFECLTGHAPFDRENSVSIMYAHLSQPPPRVSAANPAIPAALDSVITRGMAKNPDDRFPTSGEFAAAARAALVGDQEHASAVVVPAPVVAAETQLGITPAPVAAAALARPAPASAPVYAPPPPATPPSAAHEAVRWGEPPLPAPAPKPGRRLLAIGAAVALAVVAAGGVAATLLTSKPTALSAPPSATATAVARHSTAPSTRPTSSPPPQSSAPTQAPTPAPTPTPPPAPVPGVLTGLSGANLPTAPDNGWAMGYDPISHQVLLVGGYDGHGNYVTSTYVWSGNGWSTAPNSNTPQVAYASIVVDPSTNSAVMLGGNLTRMWTWNGTQWAQLPAAATPPLNVLTVAADPTTKHLIAVGSASSPQGAGQGQGQGQGPSQVVYSWDGSTWQQLSSPNDPSFGGFISGTLAYDPAGKVMVYTDAATGQTLVFNGKSWKIVSTSQVSPPVTAGPGTFVDTVAYDPATAQLVLVAPTIPNVERAGLVSTWIWNSSQQQWVHPYMNEIPSPGQQTIVYDPALKQMVGVQMGHNVNSTMWGWIPSGTDLGWQQIN